MKISCDDFNTEGSFYSVFFIFGRFKCFVALVMKEKLQYKRKMIFFYFWCKKQQQHQQYNTRFHFFSTFILFFYALEAFILSFIVVHIILVSRLQGSVHIYFLRLITIYGRSRYKYEYTWILKGIERKNAMWDEQIYNK